MATNTTHRVSDPIQTVTSASFSSVVLEATGRIVVEFMSYGCAHCRAIEPILAQVAQMVRGDEQIFRINIAVDIELANSYGIGSTPTFVMFLNGAEMGRVEGPKPTVASVLAAVTESFRP
jgi:thioredoxin 1